MEQQRYGAMKCFAARVYLTEDPKTTYFANKEKIVVEKFQPDITFLVEKYGWTGYTEQKIIL